MRTLALTLILLALTACAVKDNIDEDGYQAGDVAAGLIEDKGIYCSAPYRGIRAVGRFIIRVLGGVALPDVCIVIDAVAGQGEGGEVAILKP